MAHEGIRQEDGFNNNDSPFHNKASVVCELSEASLQEILDSREEDDQEERAIRAVELIAKSLETIADYFKAKKGETQS